MALSSPIELDTEKLRADIRAVYARVATAPGGEFHQLEGVGDEQQGNRGLQPDQGLIAQCDAAEAGKSERHLHVAARERPAALVYHEPPEGREREDQQDPERHPQHVRQNQHKLRDNNPHQRVARDLLAELHSSNPHRASSRRTRSRW